MIFVYPFAKTRFVLSGAELLDRNSLTSLTSSVALFLMAAFFSFMIMVLTAFLSFTELRVSN